MQPARQRLNAWLVILLVAALSLTACTDTFNRNLATFNAAATQAAGGVNLDVTLPSIDDLFTPIPVGITPQAGNVFDVRNTPTAGISSAWGQVNSLPSGTAFTIIATETQAGQFVIQTMQLNGWSNVVMDGSIALGSGQLRLDMSLTVNRPEGGLDAGTGTATFQPTLDGMGRMRLNPQGASFGSLNIPDGFLGGIGDAVTTLLIGASNDGLSRVNLTQIELLNGVFKVSGTIR